MWGLPDIGQSMLWPTRRPSRALPTGARIETLPGPSGKASLAYALRDLYAKGQATEHDMVVASELVEVLTGGAKADHTEAVSEEAVLKMERAAFMRLVKTPSTLARVEHMLETGKPLRN